MGSPKIPQAAPPPPAPTEEQPEVQKSTAAVLDKRRAARGYMSTILTRATPSDQPKGLGGTSTLGGSSALGASNPYGSLTKIG